VALLERDNRHRLRKNRDQKGEYPVPHNTPLVSPGSGVWQYLAFHNSWAKNYPKIKMVSNNFQEVEMEIRKASPKSWFKVKVYDECFQSKPELSSKFEQTQSFQNLLQEYHEQKVATNAPLQKYQISQEKNASLQKYESDQEKKTTSQKGKKIYEGGLGVSIRQGKNNKGDRHKNIT
jgi:hypothetical protein